ncbi:MAG TPA: histidine ammonia-lyase [Thermoanaerobaculia bacterium]|nr:histidine ammonia-lyase [Thermoanaerobaculia bacterium]
MTTSPAPATPPLEIDGRSLALEDFRRVVVGGVPCRLAAEARERVAAGRRVVERVLGTAEAVYGLNTGFGDLASVRIPADRLAALQERLIKSHAAGMGEPLDDRAVRGMLLLRANTLARGHSGVRVEVVERLLDMLAHDMLPVVPSRGSVGASGDLAPLAHLALPILGGGRVRFEGREMPSAEALARCGLAPLALAPKEGLALINGTQAMTALLALAVLEARRLVKVADLAGALSTDALRGTDAAFDARLHRLRPHPGQQASAANLWRLLQGSAIRESHRVGDVRVQDPYSLRCMPQVHGAVRDLVVDVERKLAVEMNSVTDNPLVFDDGAGGGELISGGNFHGEPMALAADVLAIALAELASISERRTEKLTNTAFSGLPPFLVEEAGLNSGFMIAQVTAAALVSENKVLCHPASVDSIPTSADKEDHVSMGMGAALKLGSVVANVQRVLAIELLAAAQGIDLLRPLTSSPPLEALHATVRERVAPWVEDREMAPDLAAAEELLAGGDLAPHLEPLD